MQHLVSSALKLQLSIQVPGPHGHLLQQWHSTSQRARNCLQHTELTNGLKCLPSPPQHGRGSTPLFCHSLACNDLPTCSVISDNRKGCQYLKSQSWQPMRLQARWQGGKWNSWPSGEGWACLLVLLSESPKLSQLSHWLRYEIKKIKKVSPSPLPVPRSRQSSTDVDHKETPASLIRRLVVHPEFRPTSYEGGLAFFF